MSQDQTNNNSKIEIEFKQAQDFIQNATAETEPSNEQKLQFYAFYKQATQGQITGKRPGAFDIINRAKYDAWKKISNLTKEEAMKSYITTLEQSSPNWRNYFTTNNNNNTTTTTTTTTSSNSITTNPTSGNSSNSSNSNSTNSDDNNNNNNIGLITNIDNEVFKKDLLRGKVIIVTGGGSGICYGITQYLQLYGAHTAIISRTYDKLEKASKEIMKVASNGTICLPVSADVRDYKALSLAFDKVLEKFGKIDVLINGSAGNFLCPASHLTPGGFKTVMEIDTFGTFNASKLAYDKYMKKHQCGNIINLSMTLHNTATIMQVHAGCAKSAIDTMTKHLAVEWGLDNIRLNSIQIGPIEGTEGFSRLLPQDELKRYKEMIPLQRFGLPIDIARMVLFLISDASSYVTGAIIPVEGASQFTTGNIHGYPNALKISKM